MDSLLLKLPAKEWYELPDSKMRKVCPTTPPEILQGTCGCECVIFAWGGGAYDPIHDKMILWGGGHDNYYGNELYAFDISSLNWELLTQPSMPAAPENCAEVLGDGRPNSRHTYGGLAYLTHVNLFFAHGGSLACGSGTSSQKTWTFNLNDTTWHDMQPTGSQPDYDVLDEYCVYDSVSQLVYIFWHGELFSYNYNENRFTHLNDVQSSWEAKGCTIDSKRGLLIEVGKGLVGVRDIRNQNYVRQNWTTTGGDEIVNAYAPGLAYDPIADRVIGWKGGSIFSLNMDTKIWEEINAPGAPQAPLSGMFGRFRYLPKYNVFIAVTSADDNVHFYKNTPDGTTGINSPNSSNFYGIHVGNEKGRGIIFWKIVNNPQIFSLEIFRGEQGRYTSLENIQVQDSDSLYIEGRYVDDLPWRADSYKLVLFDFNHEPIEEKELENSPANINDFSLTDPFPNPSQGELNLVIQSPQNVLLNFKIFDILGRKVREFETDQYQKSCKQVVWDGMDEYGKPVSKGVYINRVRAFSVKNPGVVLWQDVKKVDLF